MYCKQPFLHIGGIAMSAGFAAVACVAGLLSHAANADVVTAFYDSDWHYSYHITHMPDIDQVRMGLPNNGSMHCVPAAAMNLVLYAANHGFADLEPGPGNWQLSSNHGAVTGMVFDMGQLMQTSGTNGTSGGNADSGFVQWPTLQQYFTFSSYLTAPEFAVNLNNVAKSLISGSIGMMSYGRYDVIGTAPGNIPIVQRDSGHATTIVRAYRNGDDMQLWVRDPADINDPDFLQSPFANRVFQVSEVIVYVADVNNPEITELRFMPQLDDGSNTGGKMRLMDGFRAIRPKAGYTFSPSQGTLGVLQPEGFGGGPGGDILAPDFDVILGATFHPQLQDFLVLAGEEAPGLFRVNPLTGESQQLPLPATPRSIATAGDGSIFVTTTDHMLHRLSPEMDLTGSVPLPNDPPPTEEVSFYYEKIKIDLGTQGVRPTSIAIALMYDRKMIFYPLDLSTPTMYDIPSALPGDLLALAIEPATGRVWFATSSSDGLFGVAWEPNGSHHLEMLSSASIVSPTGLDFDDAGNLYVCNSGQLTVLRRGVDGGWAVDPASPFSGAGCDGAFAMMRDSTNFDPAHHDHPAWSTNIPPENLDIGQVDFDCPGDLDGTGNVDVADLLAMLAAFGPCENCAGDLDGDGLIGVSDLLALLASWGPCP